MDDIASVAMFWEAALDDTLRDLRRYVAAQIDVNASDRFGQTALHKAAVSSSKRAVEFLLKLPDIQLTTKDVGGDTPLDLATKFGNDKIVAAIESEINRRKRNSLKQRKMPLPQHAI
jgi:ankyrin repeat protein